MHCWQLGWCPCPCGPPSRGSTASARGTWCPGGELGRRWRPAQNGQYLDHCSFWSRMWSIWYMVVEYFGVQYDCKMGGGAGGQTRLMSPKAVGPTRCISLSVAGKGSLKDPGEGGPAPTFHKSGWLDFGLAGHPLSSLWEGGGEVSWTRKKNSNEKNKQKKMIPPDNVFLGQYVVNEIVRWKMDYLMFFLEHLRIFSISVISLFYFYFFPLLCIFLVLCPIFLSLGWVKISGGVGSGWGLLAELLVSGWLEAFPRG